MTQDEIKEMIAKVYGVVWANNAQLRAFAKLVADRESEACAKHLDNQNTAITDILAAEIRARKQE